MDAWRCTRFELDGTQIKIELRDPKRNGFAVLQDGLRMDVNGEFDFEPLPSSRTDEWIANHTFYDLADAKKAVLKYLKGENNGM